MPRPLFLTEFEYRVRRSVQGSLDSIAAKMREKAAEGSRTKTHSNQLTKHDMTLAALHAIPWRQIGHLRRIARFPAVRKRLKAYYSTHPCFICNLAQNCSHREPLVTLAALEYLSAPRKPVQSAKEPHGKTAVPEQRQVS